MINLFSKKDKEPIKKVEDIKPIREVLDHEKHWKYFSDKYIHYDKSGANEQLLIVGNRGCGKGLICAYKIRDYLKRGLKVYTTSKPLDSFLDIEFEVRVKKGWFKVEKEKRVIKDWLIYLDIGGEKARACWETLYHLQDCCFIDPEMWARFGGKDSQDQKLKNNFRKFFSLLRHNNVNCVVAGQDETQIPFEFRKSFDKIVYLRKLPAVRWFFNMFKNRPMGIEVRIYDRDHCFNNSNRIELNIEPLEWFVFYPEHAIDGAVFDTHNERTSQEKIKAYQEALKETSFKKGGPKVIDKKSSI